ncbi:hypothetical protein R6Q59_022877 [Mikania micrantha]|uniref:K Homology domain-containing protein n=1 Tax=Mikania micrantha TaxID=192012 RepID=A0A5N6MZ21_9ASTR|nr:hypothetical protein E3N88_27927 [Mikania micrantha]
MAGAPFNSLPIYTAATAPAAPPPPTISKPTTNATVVNCSPNRKKTQQTPLNIPSVSTCFRLLCHTSRIGGVIGKSGSVIKQLQQDTSSKIRVLDAPPGSEYRVISVIADSTVNRTLLFVEESYQETDGYEESDEYTQVSAAQLALVRVYERVLSVAAEADGCFFASEGVVSCRLLANTSVVGFVIGRGGKIVEKIRNDIGCMIRFCNERLPSCAMPADEMIEIEGCILAVKKALIAVAGRIQDCPPSDRSGMTFGEHDNRFYQEPVLPNGHMDHFARPHNGFSPMSPNRYMDHFPPTRPQNGFNPNRHMDHFHPTELENGFNCVLQNRHMDHFPPARTQIQEHSPTSSANYASGGPHFGSLSAETSPSMDFRTSQNQHEVVFRILCSSDCVGGVIGKSGTIVRAIENQTGASIRTAYPLADCNERLITITATESPESQNSPAQNAVILVFSRAVETAYEKGLDSPSSGAPISAKLVIPHCQMGCLLGKGGSIMADMRKVTGSYIKIVNGSNFPGCASETDEVVLMTGEFVNVRDALYSVTGRLRNYIFTNGPKTYGRRNDQPPFEMHASLAANHSNQHASLTQSMEDLSLFNNGDHHPSSFVPCQSQAGAGNSMNGHDVDKGSTSGKCGIELGRGGRSAIITNTTVEILVPENDIGCVLGENGNNLTRLRQISGAKVVVHEPGPGKADYVVVISGTPDQTQSAQSLLQAFILADQH